MSAVLYEVTGRVARLTLNRPQRGNGLNRALLDELEAAVERADLDPNVHVLLLAGAGKGFCGGYDLVESAEGMGEPETADEAGERQGAQGMGEPETAGEAGKRQGAQGMGEPETAETTGERQGAASRADAAPPPGSPLDPRVIAANHDPDRTWDPTLDYVMMSRNVRTFMALFHCSKPVVAKVHGFCVAGGTDLALCSDLLVIAADATIGYPPARVWGSPTTSMWAYRLGPQRAKRLLFTGDCIDGRQALEWGLAIEAPEAAELEQCTEQLVGRIAQMPLNQLRMMKLLCNQSLYAQGLHTTQIIGTLFDGIARHTEEGYAFQRLAATEGFKAAVRARDEPWKP